MPPTRTGAASLSTASAFMDPPMTRSESIQVSVHDNARSALWNADPMGQNTAAIGRRCLASPNVDTRFPMSVGRALPRGVLHGERDSCVARRAWERVAKQREPMTHGRQL